MDNNALIKMFSTRRPAGSKSEKGFIRDFIVPLGVNRDAKGNLFKRIGDAPVLWSCHTDSVHRDSGTQDILLEGDKLQLGKKSKSNCLGADDAAGCWLAREMILAGRPGLYVFHRNEEHGGIGSRHIATRTPELLTDIKYAIAFDRHGKNDVITHQGYGRRCCSDEFATALAGKLGENYKPNNGGIFTDTANYVGLIPECTNISVGYENEHSSREIQDVTHLFKLRDVLVKLDTHDLPVVRDPKSPPEYKEHWNGGKQWMNDDYYYNSKHGTEVDGEDSHGRYSGSRHWKWNGDKWVKKTPAIIKPEPKDYSRWTGKTPTNEGTGSPWLPSLRKTIIKEPDTVIKILKSYGFSEQDILDEIYKNGGALHY